MNNNEQNIGLCDSCGCDEESHWKLRRKVVKLPFGGKLEKVTVWLCPDCKYVW